MRRLALDEGDGYLASQACRIVGCSYRQIDYWNRCGVVTPSISPRRGSGTVSRYSRDDLVRLRVARILFDRGMKADRVRQALTTLTQADTDGQHAEYLIVADTYTAVASDQTSLVEHLTADTEAITVIRVPRLVTQ